MREKQPSKPTGYTISMEADVLWLLLRCYGNSVPRERIDKFGSNHDLNERTTELWRRCEERLRDDGVMGDERRLL